jgi:hypothetical protein
LLLELLVGLDVDLLGELNDGVEVDVSLCLGVLLLDKVIM